MKKTVITSLLMLLAVGATARQLNIDLRAGASAATFAEQHLSMGLRCGASVGCMFGKGIGLRTGLFYTEKGATASNNVFERRSSQTTRLMWLDLPAEVAGAVRLSERSKLELHGGFYVARLLKSKISTAETYRANGWDAGLGVGFDFVIGHFIVGPEVQYGLTEIVTPGPNHNITYALTLGYRF